MLIVIQKRILRGLLGLCCILLVLSLLPKNGGSRAAGAEAEIPITVIIDPGHGGEDGGAVADDGTAEAAINLVVSLRLRELCRLTGVRAVMTREEDVSIHTQGDTIRARKASDIRNRVELVNAHGHAVLISIHQNSLPQAKSVWGAQAFYNGGEGGKALAETVQQRLNESINTHREKPVRSIDGGVYLLNHADCPAVLVECGFLSNPEETEKLKTDTHQKKIALTIAAGYLDWQGSV